MKRPRVKAALRALSHRNYRLFFSGQAISLIGTWMTRLASSWLVYRLTNDPFMLGVVNFAGLVPNFVLGPFAGVWVDNTKSLRRLVLVTQIWAMLQSFGLVAAAYANLAGLLAPQATINVFIALNVMQGVINAFDIPARQAFLPQMVPDQKDLANGIALNSTLFNSARLIGPAVAGMLIGLVGEVWCFGIDAISYVGVLVALLAMRLPPDEVRLQKQGKLLGSFVEGLQYAYRFEPIRVLLVLVAVLSFMGMPYTVLLPVYAQEILGGGPYTLGLLTSAAGLGAVIGALRLASRESIMGIGKIIVGAGVLFVLSLTLFAYSRSLPFSLVTLLVAGYGMITQSASCNTILQTIVAPDKRGRVMSLYSTAFVGMAPFGSLFAGFLAKKIGTPNTLAVCAVCCLASTLFFAWRLPHVRAIARKHMAH